jgi:hypothetical protein
MWVGIGVGIGRNRFATGIFNAYALRVTADGGITETGQCVDAVSGLLLNASLLLIPSGYKGGKLYAEIPTNGNGDLTWTRGSDGFRTNASGLIQRVPWNLLQQSETFDNAIWSKTNTTIVANAETAPNGTLTADTMTVPDSTTNLSQGVSYGSGEYTFSVYVKIISQTTGGVMRLQGFVDGANVSMNFTPTTEWQLFTATFNATTSITSLRIRGQAFVGTLAIWGAQLVQGTTAQTYLPTTDRLNFPRLSYMYGSCPSVLLEPQRTNLALQSETFDNASWTKLNSSITANTTTSPDGTTNADSLIENTASGLHIIYQLLTTTATTYSLSCYIKPDTRTRAFLRSDTSSGTARTLFDLTGAGSVVSLAHTSASITLIGNGWYRCVITFTEGTGASGRLFAIEGAVGINVSYVGNGLNAFYLYGAQLEAGAYPTSYIPTTSSSATRVADSFSRNNIYTNGLITSSGGTWFVELLNNVAYTRDGISTGLFIDTDASSYTNGINIRNGGGGSTRLVISKWVGGTGTPLFTTTTDTVKIAVKWNGTTADVFVNGTKQVSATSFTPTAMQFVKSEGNQVPVFISQMDLFPTPLSDTDCTTLTTL